MLFNDTKEFLNEIFDSFGCYSGKILEKMTHSEYPWQLARERLKYYQQSNKIIKKESIFKYFENVKIKYNMLNMHDIKDYSSYLFSKIR